MTRLIVLFAASCLLTACATHSNQQPPPAEQPKPAAADPRICADAPAEPVLPDGATIVQPVTADEGAATEAYLGWVQSALDWGRQGWARATIAKTDACH